MPKCCSMTQRAVPGRGRKRSARPWGGWHRGCAGRKAGIAMTAFETKISPGSETFAQNREDMLALVKRMRDLEARAAAKSEERRPVFDKRGQLSPRERVSALLDPGLPFLELYNMASYLVDDPDPETSIPGASIILGIGFVEGVRAMVFADDAGINAGAMTQKSVDKALGAIAIAERQKLPFIHLVESLKRRPDALHGGAVGAWRRHVCRAGAAVGGGHSGDHGAARRLHRRMGPISRACRTM